MATVTVDQAKLVLNSFAAIFQNNLVSADLVTWKKFDKDFNARNALTVSEQVTPDYTTTTTTNGVKDLSGGVQDTVFGSEMYKLDETISTDMGWGDFVSIRDMDDARESQALRKAALRLATDIDAKILGFAALASNNWMGDGNTAVSEWDDIAQAYTRLKEEGVDNDSNLRAVLTYGDKQALGSDIVGNSNNGSQTNFGDGVYRNGFTGDVAGMKTLFTQQLPALTVGTRVASATSLTEYASGTPVNDYEDVAISPAPGQYLTGLIKLDGQSGSVTLVDGETFTIAGVYAYDPRSKKQLDHLQEFRVIGNYTASSGVFAAVRYFPAIIESGPYQTVVNTNSGGTWNNLAVTHKGAAGATLHPRFIADKDAIIVSTANLPTPFTGKGSTVSLKKVPIMVRMWQDSVFATGEHRVRFDVAIKANVAADGRRKLVRINGTA